MVIGKPNAKKSKVLLQDIKTVSAERKCSQEAALTLVLLKGQHIIMYPIISPVMMNLMVNPVHSCISTMNKMSLAVTQVHTLLVYIVMQTDLWLDQFMLSVHTSAIQH